MRLSTALGCHSLESQFLVLTQDLCSQYGQAGLESGGDHLSPLRPRNLWHFHVVLVWHRKSEYRGNKGCPKAWDVSLAKDSSFLQLYPLVLSSSIILEQLMEESSSWELELSQSYKAWSYVLGIKFWIQTAHTQVLTWSILKADSRRTS